MTFLRYQIEVNFDTVFFLLGALLNVAQMPMSGSSDNKWSWALVPSGVELRHQVELGSHIKWSWTQASSGVGLRHQVELGSGIKWSWAQASSGVGLQYQADLEGVRCPPLDAKNESSCQDVPDVHQQEKGIVLGVSFSLIHTKMRNRIGVAKALKLVFCYRLLRGSTDLDY